MILLHIAGKVLTMMEKLCMLPSIICGKSSDLSIKSLWDKRDKGILCTEDKVVHNAWSPWFLEEWIEGFVVSPVSLAAPQAPLTERCLAPELWNTFLRQGELWVS